MCYLCTCRTWLHNSFSFTLFFSFPILFSLYFIFEEVRIVGFANKFHQYSYSLSQKDELFLDVIYPQSCQVIMLLITCSFITFLLFTVKMTLNHTSIICSANFSDTHPFSLMSPLQSWRYWCKSSRIFQCGQAQWLYSTK